MIDPLAIDEWLAKPRPDSAAAKRFTTRALRAKVDRLEPRPEFVLEPFTHQLVGFLLCAKYPGYTLHMDMGTGKTAVAINVFRWRKARGEAGRALVLVPGTSNVDEWGRELDTHGPELRYVQFDATMGPEDRDRVFWDREASDVAVMTYMGLVRLLTKAKGSKRIADEAAVRRACRVFGMLVCDESTAIKNPNSVIFRILRKFTRNDRVPYRLCLTGTPANMSMLDLWSQFYVADGGQTLGKTLGWYRQAFFREEEGQFARVYKIREKKIPTLHRILRSGALRYEDHECQDLPDVMGGIANPMIRMVPMSIAQGRRVHGYREDMKAAAIDDDIEEVKNIYYAMRCLSSGYVPVESGGFHDFAQNPKLEVLMGLLAEAPDHHWLVFLHHKHTADLIGDALKKARIDYVEVSGRVSNKAAALRKFRGSTRVMLGSGAAALGLNLQHCSRTAYFESPDSIAVRRQSEKRTHRHGQRQITRFYDLVVRGTYDGRIIDALQNGKRVLDAVVDGRELC